MGRIGEVRGFHLCLRGSEDDEIVAAARTMEKTICTCGLHSAITISDGARGDACPEICRIGIGSSCGTADHQRYPFVLVSF